jgi:gamma-glutamyl:cysteine ligase YbdK (ATP-grasp superfamily)
MGQEISQTKFQAEDFQEYTRLLRSETECLNRWFAEGRMAEDRLKGGFEIECWLLDSACLPAPRNMEFLRRFNNPLVSPELARFNIEFNNKPLALTGNAMRSFHNELQTLLDQGEECASSFDDPMSLIMIGILPTLQTSHLGEQSMSEMRRYYALNEQIMKRRHLEPIHFNIAKKDSLEISSHTVMLEAATTSFQVHLQVPASLAHHYYNASLLLSAPMLAISANSPFLFQHELWDETRIPLFEHAIDTANKHSPIKRVSFGSGFLKNSIMECFEENLEHFRVLLPIIARQANHLEHLRLHNGAIWRWNRPLIGFNTEGIPHVRIEHRVMPAGPTIIDMMANAVFYYGLVHYWAQKFIDGDFLPSFTQCRENFYQAARDSLTARFVWGEQAFTARELILDEMIDQSHEGLEMMGINSGDADFYTSIIRARADSGQTGSNWQRLMLKATLGDYSSVTRAYLGWQKTGKPVHQWNLK